MSLWRHRSQKAETDEVYLQLLRISLQVLIFNEVIRGSSSVGRAPESHSGGRGFDSPLLHALITGGQVLCNEALPNPARSGRKQRSAIALV